MANDEPYSTLQDSSAEDSTEHLPASWLDRLNPRTLVGIAIAAMSIVLLVGFLALYFFTQFQSAAPVPGSATPTSAQTAPPASLTAPATDPAPPPTPTRDLTATHLAETVTHMPDLPLATLTEIVGTVRIKAATLDWMPVTSPLTVQPGTTILTDESSSVKITLSDGGVIRLGSQTQLVLVEMSRLGAVPVDRLQLDFGKLWAIVASPFQGQFEVQLPVGVAAVRGTFMSVEHNTTDKVEIVTCLEGQCRYQNSNGGVDLTTQQQTESINGAAPSAPHRMDRNQVEDWNQQRIPEVITLTPTPTKTRLPTLTFTPSPTFTPSNTFTPSPTAPTNTPTLTSTPSRTATPSATPTPTSTSTPTPTVTVTPGPATRLGFVLQPPTSTTAGVPFSLRVAIQDASGATVPYAPGTTITVAIGANPGSSTLSGTTSVGTLNGVADFPNLSLNKTGVGYTLVASAAGLTSATSIAFNINPGGLAAFSVAGIPASVTAGDDSSVTVSAVDAQGNVVPTYTGTIRFSASDPVATLPGNYTFTVADVGVHTFGGVVFKTAGVQSVTVVDAGNPAITGSQPGITVLHGKLDHFEVKGIANPARVGDVSSVTVTAKDRYNNTVVNYEGTITFSASDPLIRPGNGLPADYTFKLSDNGTVTLSSVSFQTVSTPPNHHTVTVMDTPFTTFGEQKNIVVCASVGPCP